MRTTGSEFGRLPLVAEDLGLITPAVDRLRTRCGLPGMRVLQFAFDSDGANPYLPHNHEPHTVVYTGTHDNDTTRGWLRAGGQDPERARRYAGCRPRDFHWGMIRIAHLSPSDLAIIPVQDLLGLDSAARMNRPGLADGNWRWHLKGGELTPRLARKLLESTRYTDRCI